MVDTKINYNIEGEGSKNKRLMHAVTEETDLELKQNISRSRNPSSDLIIAPEPRIKSENNNAVKTNGSYKR